MYNFQRLKDYALWYYFRYYPSNKKLLQKLEEKGSLEDTQKIFQQIKNLLKEDEIIASKIDNYIYRNKNYRYIYQKMSQKLFPRDKIENYLEKYKNSWESLLDKNFLKKKIENYIQKGKSKKYIYSKLWETPQDREKLKEVFSEYFSQWEYKNIEKNYQKLLQKYPREKIIQKLMMMWFNYWEIKETLDF